MTKYLFDPASKNLSQELIEKQKGKGTYDSPCMSVCNYAGEFMQCQTCGMRQSEKVEWKQSSGSKKRELLKTILGRRK